MNTLTNHQRVGRTSHFLDRDWIQRAGVLAHGCDASLRVRMSELNFHHLRLFWSVAREGGITRGSRALHLTPQTISGQLREFESALGVQLLRRAGRGIALTEEGQVVYEYAESVFSQASSLMTSLQTGAKNDSPPTMRVGITESLPKLLVWALLDPTLAKYPNMRLHVNEGPPDEVIAQLAVDKLDVVLSDQPIPSTMRVRAYNHLLGDCGVAFMGTREVAQRLRRRFPASLDAERVLLPTSDAVVRRDLEQWFVRVGVRPNVVGEFQDSALLKVFGQAGAGVFAVPTAVEKVVAQQYGVVRVGVADGVRERYYAISVERRIRHQAVSALYDVARTSLFSE